MMSIPTDETAVTAAEMTNKKNQNKDTVNLLGETEQAPLTGDLAGGAGGEYIAEEDKVPLTEPVQIAGLGSLTKGLIKQGGKAIDAGVDYWNEKMGAVDATTTPSQRIKKEERKKENERIKKEVEGEQPFIQTDEGTVFFKPMPPAELNKVKSYMQGDVDFDVVLPNLDKIDSKKSDDTADVQFKKLIGAMFEHYKNQKDTTGKKILEGGKQYKDGKVIDKGQSRSIRSFNDIINDANKIGSVDIMLQLLRRGKGERPFTDSELLAAKRTVLSFTVVAEKAMQQFEKSGSAMDLAKAHQALNIAGYAQIQLVGVQEEIARTLVSNKIIASPGQSRIQALKTWQDTNTVGEFTAVLTEKNLAEYMEANGGEAAVRTMLASYKALPNDVSKNKFLKMTLLDRAKMTPRALVEIYTSALLSSGVTHAYNTVSQVAFYEMLMAEKFIAGMTGDKDEMAKAMAMLKGHITYLPQALRNMTHALLHEKSLTENTSKLDMAGRTVTRQGFGLRNRAEGGGLGESAAALAIDGLGVTYRMLGYRPMIAIDEFFKTMARGVEIEGIGMRQKSLAYTNRLKEINEKITNEGIDISDYKYEKIIDPEKGTKKIFTGDEAIKKEAYDFSVDSYLHTINKDSTFQQGSEFARMLTFQDDLPGVFQGMTRFFNLSGIKIWVPFYKTPSQIVRRVTERTPLAVLMPGFYKKLISGSATEKREALVRATTGTLMFATLAYAGTGGMNEGYAITGYGPRDKKYRKTWLENHQPYSIGVRKKNEDGTYKEGPDAWTWISYARYDPLSGMLAMAGDFNDVLLNIDDEDTIVDILSGAGLATMRYTATALPMTQFIGEFIDLMGSPFQSHESQVERVTQLLTKQVFAAGGIVKEHVTFGVGDNFKGPADLPGVGIMLEGSVERSGYGERAKFGDMTVGSEMASSTLPDNQYDDVNIPFWNRPVGLQPVMRAWYENLNTICSKTIGCSSELPVKTNRWYEPMPQTRGGGWEFASPYRVINLPHANLVNQELAKLNLGLSPLSYTMGEPQIKLNAEQYDRYKELYNYPRRGTFAKEYFKSEVYSGGENLMPGNILEEFKDIIKSTGYEKIRGITGLEPAPPAHKIDLLKGVDNAHKKYAKDLLVLEYPELKALLLERDEFRKRFGENPRNLSDPNIFEIQRAIQENRKTIE